jgi:thioredoxin-dependent peroxiredoxin
VINEGDQAPDFTLQSDAGTDVTLSSLRGRPVVVYFYPRDDTPTPSERALHLFALPDAGV